MERVNYLFRLLNIEPENVKHKRKYKLCKRKFLAVRVENGAVRLFGSHNVRCSQPLTACLNCRRYVNINVLIPKKDIDGKGLEKALIDLPEMTWGTANALVNKYVIPKVSEIVSKLEKDGEVRLI